MSPLPEKSNVTYFSARSPKNSKPKKDNRIEDRKKEKEKERVKRALTGNGIGALSGNKLTILLFGGAFIISLFFGHYLLGKLIAAGLIIAAIVLVFKKF